MTNQVFVVTTDSGTSKRERAGKTERKRQFNSMSYCTDNMFALQLYLAFLF